MTTRGRIAITAGCALALAITVLGTAWTAGPGTQGWAIATLAAYGLALVGAFLVNRWWALLPAPSTVAVGWLGSLIYQPPQRSHEEAVSFPVYAWVMVVALEIVLPAAFIALGLLARRIWDNSRGRSVPARSGVGR